MAEEEAERSTDWRMNGPMAAGRRVRRMDGPIAGRSASPTDWRMDGRVVGRSVAHPRDRGLTSYLGLED